MRPSFSSNDQLVDYLVEKDRIRSDKVEKAFRKVDRRKFIPEKHSNEAYTDKPIPIEGVTVSAPHIVAEVTELLELSGSEEVLEIGSGSGYQAAILGKLVEEVVGIEINEKLVEYSKSRVPKNVEIRNENGFNNIDRKFDRILFSCATESFEEAIEHVKHDGIIVGPVKVEGKQVLKKWKSGNITDHGGVRYVEMED